jgi:predicted TIM-barrel fold metal-dependent hydrolase
MSDRETRPRFIDGDAHILEPLAMWERLPPAFRARVNIQLSDHPYYRDKLIHLDLDGHPIPTWRGDRKERMARIIERMEKKQMPRGAGFEPAQVLRDLDTEGLDAVALYPTFCLMAPWIPRLGAEFAGAVAAAYNDYIHDFCAIDRRRLRPVMVIAPHDIGAALREIERNEKRGFIGVFVRPNPIYDRTLAHPDYWPLYDMLQSLELPLGIHEGTHSYVPTAGLDRVSTQAGHHIVSHPLEQMLAFLSMHEAGVFERFPRLKALFLECGTGWVPYWLERIDAERHQYRSTQTGRLAAEVFREQCFVTAEVDDPFLPTVISLIGDDNILLSTDYPHDESHYPDSHRLFMEQKITPESRERIGRLNSLRAYPRFASY